MVNVAIILGYGGNVGAAVASKLLSEGYKVAVGSRNPNFSQATDNLYPFKIDLNQPENIENVWKGVEAKVGPANVVLFNAAGVSFPSSDLLSIPLSDYTRDVTLGTTAVYASAQQAVKGFRKVSASSPKVFIMTGNILPFKPFLPFITLGTAKSGGAFMIDLLSQAYKDEGYRFYFASQVNSQGWIPGPEFSGAAHATAYWNLINQKEQGDWDVRFVKTGAVWKKPAAKDEL